MTVVQRDMACDPLWAVLKDCAAWDRRLWKSLKGDLYYLQERVKHRGMYDLLVSLPEAGKHFDACLSAGFFNSTGYPSVLPMCCSGEPQLFRALYELVFDFESDTLTQGIHAIRYDADPNAIFFLRTFLYLYKKLEVECPRDKILDAVKDFKAIDQGLREPSLHWDAHPVFFESSLGIHRRILFANVLFGEDMDQVSDKSSYFGMAKLVVSNLDAVSSILWSRVPSLDFEGIVPSHGPGAVADLRGSEDKYKLPSWPHKLEWFFPHSQFAYSDEEYAKSDSLWYPGTLEVRGKLTAVPKTYKAPRLITVEPTSHQFLQQGLLQWLRHHMPQPLRYCIDFQSQIPSRDAARKSSIDGLSATVDLSSASDRLSLWTVERAIRSTSVLKALYATRTSVVEDNTGTGGFDFFTMKKFAGQGSAVTFPVQSIVYATCCIAAVLSANSWVPNERNIRRASKLVRVFGDDIVVPTRALLHLDIIFKLLELKINVGKTHYQGGFRESCGGDYFRGYDVTPLYLRTLGQDEQAGTLTSLVDVSNNAYSKGLWFTSEAILKMIPAESRRLLCISNVPQACLTLRTFTDQYLASKERYNKRLHRGEIFGLVPKTDLRTKQREGFRDLLDFFLRSSTRTSGTANRTDRLHEPWSRGYSRAGKINFKPAWVLLWK